MAASLHSVLCCFNLQNPNKTLQISPSKTPIRCFKSNLPLKTRTWSEKSHLFSNETASFNRLGCVYAKTLSTISVGRTDYEFSDGAAEVELRLQLGGRNIQSSKDIVVDVDESSLTVKVHSSGSLITLMRVNHLYEKIKPAETIWYIDEDQLVINLKKRDTDLKWPDILETWQSLTTGALQLLQGTSIYIIGDTTAVNKYVARELAVGLGYTPLSTSDLLETFAQQTIESWLVAEGANSVAEGEAAILESLSSHVRTVVATLGGQHGAAGRADKWQHLYSGFTVWVSKSETTDEASAKEEARRNVQDGSQGYSNADMVVKLGGWDSNHAQTVAQACLSALKQLIISDKKLPGKKSLYIRLGCRGDWPNIKPPGWDPSSGADTAGA
ncbi:Shikimate kinase/Threonine synthase-like protein 1 [Cinnamomum micranthum f. kanehirae]|uniref:Shikimate kinase/Threonine synthase-like protein 1 n=1 Tax=Cinnamomum micranthum f. kanehirae TaxID=337451 RepID=A0A3S3N7I6_9MAGN|nr:Shikimate kinase/Threonine synthase-like protein 1 [Cinnamomum micranthum f. kanehirae]